MRMIAWLSTVRFGESHVIMGFWGATALEPVKCA
jgi:hypothetical protein